MKFLFLSVILIYALENINALDERKIILFLPLDERFATRGLWLNLAKIASEKYEIRTPKAGMYFTNCCLVSVAFMCIFDLLYHTYTHSYVLFFF